MSSHSLLQGILPTQGSNRSLPHGRQILYHLSYPGKFLSSAHCRHSTILVLCLPFLLNYGAHPPSTPKLLVKIRTGGFNLPAFPPFHMLVYSLPPLLPELCWGQTVRSCSLTTTTALSKEWAFSVGSDTVPMQSWTTTETPEKGLEPQSDAGKPLFISRLLPWMCACAQSTLCDPMDCSPPGSSVHGILLARALEWGAMPSSRGSSRPRDQTHVSFISCTGKQVIYH